MTAHVSDEGTRADLDAVIGPYAAGCRIYTCGPERYMSSVTEAAERLGWPDESLHLEYFSAPDAPEYENHPFKLKIKASGAVYDVPEDKSAADVLIENGHPIDIKCSDGLCGVCKCGLVAGEVEHRDYVLSKKQRADAIITCQSRAAEPDAVIEVDPPMRFAAARDRR